LSNASDALLGSPFRPDTLFCHALLECSRGQGVANYTSVQVNKRNSMNDSSRRSSSKSQSSSNSRSGRENGETKEGDSIANTNATFTRDVTMKNRVWTVEFDDYVDGGVKKVLIDHVLTSPNLKNHLERCDVAHESYMFHCKHSDGNYTNEKNRQRHHRPADHRPIWADFKLEK